MTAPGSACSSAWTPDDRFASVLLYVPRERYDSGLRARAGALLAEAYGGRISAYYPSFSDAPLARVHFIVGFNPGDHKKPDLRKIEDQIAAAARTWEDLFSDAVRGQNRPMAQVAELLGRYGGAFTAGYKDKYDSHEALADLQVLETLSVSDGVHIRAYRRPDDARTQFRFKLYRPGAGRPGRCPAHTGEHGPEGHGGDRFSRHPCRWRNGLDP